MRTRMAGGPSHVDLLDPKPILLEQHGLEMPASPIRKLVPYAEAAKAKGDAAAEQKAADDLAKIWKGDPAMLTLGRL